MGMVSDQIYQNEKDSHVMIGILSHIVEFRNMRAHSMYFRCRP